MAPFLAKYFFHLFYYFMISLIYLFLFKILILKGFGKDGHVTDIWSSIQHLFPDYCGSDLLFVYFQYPWKAHGFV